MTLPKATSQPVADDVVDYGREPADASAKRRIARFATRWSFVTFLPSLVMPFVVFIVDPVGRHMLSGWAFDDYILMAEYSSLLGVSLGLAGGTSGSEWGWFWAVANGLAVFMLPAFTYA